MKFICTALLVVAGCAAAHGQSKHNLYLDAGVTRLGIGATYDRKVTKHFDIGVGINAYDYSDQSYAKLRSACYLDLRPHWSFGKSMLFVFVDIGAAYNAGAPDSATINSVGMYSALGLGYHYRINKKGMGPYASAGMYGYYETVKYPYAYHLPVAAREYSVFDASLVLSVGFKF